MADWWDRKQRWKRRWQRWRRHITGRVEAWQRARRDRQERTRMEESTPITAPVPLATVGRAILARFDPETISAISAAISEEIKKEVYEAAVQEARRELEQEFATRRERLLDQLARDRQQIERDAEARLEAEIAAGIRDQAEEFTDRLDTLRTQRRDAEARAQAAEAVVVSLVTQLCGGVTDPPRPTYLYSGGRGLTALDKAAINRILGHAGVVLKSKATASERRVVVSLGAGQQAEHTVFWLSPTPVEDVVYADDGDESGTEPKPPAEPEGTSSSA